MLSTSRISALAAVACVAATAALFTSLARPEATIERSFASALQQLPAQPASQPAANGIDPAYLRLASLPAPHAMRGPVHLGDRISWSGTTGEAETYEIVDVQPLQNAMSIGYGATGDLVLVTATGVGTSASGSLRFVIEVKPELPLPAPIKPRAL